jgi:acetoin utilization deacetylase AcuC-like enzyme
VFALRGLDRRPEDPVRQVGYYCFDPQTPLLEGDRLAYALCRPPGHHAGRDYYGRYCYLNNAALAAQRLLSRGRPAILDLDYHHGNGTQDIFYDSAEVLFVSLHADPNSSYPSFSGYREQRGSGAGLGFNLKIRAFQPDYLVVSLSVDTVQGDPVGGLQLPVESFPGLGKMIGSLALPSLVVQEGGYSLRLCGACVTGFLAGLSDGS